MKKILVLIPVIICFYSCQTKGNAEDETKADPNELTLISGPETVERVKAGNFNYGYAAFKNAEGNELTAEDKALLNDGLLAQDFYEDGNGVIKEVRLRPIQLADKFIEIQRRVLGVNPFIGIELIDIDCKKLDELYEGIRQSDQKVRNEGGNMVEIDSFNQRLVISALNKCGWREQYLETIWLIFQHSETEIIAHYYPILKSYSEAGALSKVSIAFMEDRLLMYTGYKQVYGSQLSNGQLYNLEDPENVNARRAEVGLGPIEDYISNWGLDLDTELARMREQ